MLGPVTWDGRNWLKSIQSQACITQRARVAYWRFWEEGVFYWLGRPEDLGFDSRENLSLGSFGFAKGDSRPKTWEPDEPWMTRIALS